MKSNVYLANKFVHKDCQIVVMRFYSHQGKLSFIYFLDNPQKRLCGNAPVTCFIIASETD